MVHSIVMMKNVDWRTYILDEEIPVTVIAPYPT